MFIVYCVISPKNKYYVGITSRSLEKRKIEHLSKSNIKQDNIKFRNCIRKYGEKLRWEIIQEVESYEEVKNLEKYYIKFFNSKDDGYNSTEGGEGTLGYKPSKERIQKLKINMTGQNNPMYGKSHSEQTKQLIKDKMIKKFADREERDLLSLKKGGVPFEVYTKAGVFVGKWISKGLCAEDLNINRARIKDCLLHRRKSHKGFIFKEVSHR